MQKYSRSNDRLATALELRDASEEDQLRLIEEYRRRSDAAFAETTKRSYRRTIRQVRCWLIDNGYSPNPPIKPAVLAEYVDSLAGRIRPNTIETRLWAIGELHKSQFLPSPCRHRLVVLALKAVKRTYGTAARQAAPLRRHEVLWAIDKLGHSRAEVRDRALLWTAADTWCRVSEIRGFTPRDIHPNGDGSSTLFIRKSKTDQEGRGAWAFLSEQGTEAVKDWIALAGLGKDDPIFCKSQEGAIRKPLDPATVSRIYKRRTGRSDVSSHSTRVGGVQDALLIGCDLSSVMIAGRWNSPEMPSQYGRRILTNQSAAAKVAQHYSSTDDRQA